MLKVETTRIPGVLVFEPRVFRDTRGFFLESFNQRSIREAGISSTFVQDNHSRSVRGTLRGLHAQRLHAQDKLVRCVRGEIFDVAVDTRRGSPTFGKWVGVRLSADNFKQLFVPAGFAHGFCVLSGEAEVEYKVTDHYHPEDEVGIVWNDPDLAIEWPLEDPILSEKDARNPTLEETLELLPEFPSPPR